MKMNLTACRTRSCVALFALLLLAVSPTQARAQGEPKPKPRQVDVYLLAGQSNMQGAGQAKELPAKWQAPIEGALIYQGGAFKTLAAGDKGRFGPEIGFAHYLRNNQPGRPTIYLIKFALSGQPLDAGWNGGAADGSSWVGAEPGPNRKTFYPGTSADDPNMGLHYRRMAEHIGAAFKQLADEGYRPRLRGVVWMQGEQDAKNQVSADRYDKTLGLLKKRIEHDFAEGRDVPFIFGQVLPHEPALDRFTHRELIRKRMAEADWRSGSERAIKNVWMVSTDGLPLNDDTVHYNTEAQIALGQSFGVELLRAQRKAESDQ